MLTSVDTPSRRTSRLTARTVAADGPSDTADIDAVRRVFDTNLFGKLAVTKAVLPLLRKSGSARVDGNASA